MRRIPNRKHPLRDHRADYSRALRKSAHTAYCGCAISADPSTLVVSASAYAGGLAYPLYLFPCSVMRRSSYDRQIVPALNPMSTKGNHRRRRVGVHGLDSDTEKRIDCSTAPRLKVFDIHPRNSDSPSTVIYSRSRRPRYGVF